jgi:hypothetical protein
MIHQRKSTPVTLGLASLVKDQQRRVTRGDPAVRFELTNKNKVVILTQRQEIKEPTPEGELKVFYQ